MMNELEKYKAGVEKAKQDLLEEYVGLSDEIAFLNHFLEEAGKRNILLSIIPYFDHPTKATKMNNMEYFLHLDNNNQICQLPHYDYFDSYEVYTLFMTLLDFIKSGLRNDGKEISELSEEQFSSGIYNLLNYHVQRYCEYCKKHLHSPEK